MSVYELVDNETGKILSVEGDSPPNQADIAELFAAYGDQAYLPESDNDSYDLDLAGEMGKAVVRGFGKGVLSAGSGLAALANTVTDNIGLEGLIDGGEENELIRLANQGKKSIDESIGVGDEYRDKWLVGAAEGFGSIGSIFAGGGIGGIIGRAGGLAGAVAGATTGSVTAGVGLGTSVQQDKVAESRSRGIEVSKGQEDSANVLGAFIGGFEAFVPLKILGKLSFVGGTTAKKKFIESLGNASVRALEEGTQEAISGLLQDAVQKNIVAYDPDIEMGESLWDDFTMGGASAFTLDLLTNAFIKKRGSITKDAELEREAQFREEEEQQNTYFSDQAEQRKSQIEQERRKRRLDALNNKADALTQGQEAEKAALQLEAENARYNFDPLMPYSENLNLEGTDLAASQIKALQAKDYASQIASAATKSGEGFPTSGDFTITEELTPEGTTFKVVHSETDQQYGQSSLEREDAIHLMSNLNDQIIRRSVNRGILDSIDETPENYSPEQAESLYFVGQKLNNPDRDTITVPMLNEAGGTTGPNYQENLSINSLHQSQYGVPPLTDRGEKIYKDLSNLTVAQKINLERVKKGLPEANEFSLSEAKAALGKNFPKVFDLLSEAKSTETGTLGDFGSVGQELEQSRNKYQNDKQVKEDLLNILEKKNITSNINSPEIQYIFKRLVGEADISSMSTSQKAYLVKELSTRLPVLPQPANIPDFTPNPYTAEQYETALENSLFTGDGSVISIKEALGDVGTDKRANVIAAAINKKLQSKGLVDSEGVFQERLLLEAPKVVEEEAVSVDLEPYSESDPTSFPDITGIPDPIVFEKNFKKKLKSIGLEDVGLRVLGTLRDAPTTRDGTLIYEKGDDKKVGRTVAYYKPSVKTIFLGIDRSSQALSNQGQEVTPQALEDALAEVLDHEMVHAVRDLDLWTKKEWESLERLAKTKMFPGEDNITFFDEARGRYSELSPVGQMEEAVAELIRVGRKDKSLITGKPKSLIKKMFSFFEKLSSAIKGSGFNTLDQVFESTLGSLESGEIGARTRGEIRTLRATEKKMRALPDRGIGREADVIDLDDVELDPESINSEVEVVSAMNDKFSRTSPVRAKTPKRKIDDIQVTYSEEFNANALAQEEIKSYREQSEALDKIIESIPESSITRGYAENNEKFQDDIAAQQSGVKPLSFQSVSHTYGRLDKIIYNVADKFIGLKNIEDTINKGRKLVNLPSIETIDSAYAGEQSISGKAGNLFREFEETRKKPLAEKIAKSGLSREQVDEFITLRHAIERNNRIALRDPNRNPESMPGSGSLPTGEVLTNSFVKARMRDLYNLTWNDATQSWDGGNKRSDNLSSVVKDLDQIINETLDRSINGGLLSKEAADSIRSIYKYYAPLQGKNIEDDFAATINGVSGKSFSIKGTEVRGALGRQSAALSPVSNIISNAEKTITRSLNNKEFGQKLVSLIGNNPNPDFWEVYSPKNPRYKKNFSKKYIYIGLDPDLSKGNYKSIPPGMNKKDFIETIDFVPDRNTEDLIGVKIGGEQYYVDIKGDDRLREALIVSDSNSSNAIVGTLGKLNRFLSMVNTQLNPEFVIGNFVRDIQTAVFNIIGEQDMPGGKARNQKLVKKVLKDTIPSMGVFYKLLKSYNVKDGTFRGDLTGISAKDQADAKEFLEAGAKADWFYARQPEEQAQAIDNMVDMANGTFSGTFRKRYQGVMQFVENANSAVENAVRLATFKAARDSFLDSGIRREEAVAKAADLAKNLTVNFNRKGMQGDLLNSLYLFFNASVQGTRNFARGLFGPKGNPFSPEASRKKQGMVASLTLFSTLLAEMGEEESEINPETGRSFYSEIPDFIKERNIVIMADPSVKEGVNTSNTYIGKDGKEFDGSQRYYLIPLPYGYNVFSYLGQAISEIGRGNMSPLKAASNLTSAMMGSFSPVGISPIPTFAQPFFEISQNENFFGAPIYKDAAMFGGTGPDSALSMRSTPEAFKFLAETANILTQPGNGSKYEKGAVDISPDSLEHLFDFALGGAGQFGKRTKGLAEKILSGEEIAESREIPFVRRLMGESNDRGSQSDYYERRALLNNKKTAYLAMQGAERTSYKEGNEDYLKMLYSLKNIESRLKKLRTKRKDAERFAANSPSHAKKFAEFEKEVFDYESELYNAFNKRYDEIVGRDK